MKAKTKKGFSYYVDEKTIREYMKVPIKDKLKWLEEANNFTVKVLSKKNYKIWEKFRKGEI